MRWIWIILWTSTAFASQTGMATTVIIWPQPQQQPRPQVQPTYSKPGPSREQIRRAIIKANEECERVSQAVQAERFKRWQASQKIDPRKDDYQKYLANKQAKADAFNDPDAEQMQDFFKQQEGRNDFKKWQDQAEKDNNEYIEWCKKNNTLPEKGVRKEKLDEERFSRDLQRTLTEKFEKPVKKTSKEENE